MMASFTARISRLGQTAAQTCPTCSGGGMAGEGTHYRGAPLWDDRGDVQTDDGAQIEPADWDLAAQPAPDFEVDQRINW